MTKRQAVKPSPRPESETPIDVIDPPESSRPSFATPRRCVDRDEAAHILSTSPDTVLRLIDTGALPVVKLPVERGTNGRGKVGVSRRVLIDLRDLDALIERSKERRGDNGPRHGGRK